MEQLLLFRALTTFKLEGDVEDNGEKRGDFLEKLIAINRNIVWRFQYYLNFVFDQREGEVNLHKVTSSSKSPSNVSLAIRNNITCYMYLPLLWSETLWDIKFDMSRIHTRKLNVNCTEKMRKIPVLKNKNSLINF